MSAFDLNVLIRLQHINQYHPIDSVDFENKRTYISSIDKLIYVPKPEAYYEMNKLISIVNEALWDDYRKDEPFYTEMLLFSIADTEIFKDITSNVEIKTTKYSTSCKQGTFNQRKTN
jgi:hypothetical protein